MILQSAPEPPHGICNIEAKRPKNTGVWITEWGQNRPVFYIHTNEFI